MRAVTRDALVEAEAAIRDASRATTVPRRHRRRVEERRHWPMEKLERSGRLVGPRAAIAGDLGFELRDAATGGASDANTTAGMGVPSIDGLGPIGGLTTPPGSTSRSPRSCPRTRCWPR